MKHIWQIPVILLVAVMIWLGLTPPKMPPIPPEIQTVEVPVPGPERVVPPDRSEIVALEAKLKAANERAERLWREGWTAGWHRGYEDAMAVKAAPGGEAAPGNVLSPGEQGRSVRRLGRWRR